METLKTHVRSQEWGHAWGSLVNGWCKCVCFKKKGQQCVRERKRVWCFSVCHLIMAAENGSDGFQSQQVDCSLFLLLTLFMTTVSMCTHTVYEGNIQSLELEVAINRERGNHSLQCVLLCVWSYLDFSQREFATSGFELFTAVISAITQLLTEVKIRSTHPSTRPSVYLPPSLSCYDSKLSFNPSSHPPSLSTTSSPFSSFTVSQRGLSSCLFALCLSLNHPSFPPSAHSILFLCHCSHILCLFRCLHLAAPPSLTTLVLCPPIFPLFLASLFTRGQILPLLACLIRPAAPLSSSFWLHPRFHLFLGCFFFLPVSDLFFYIHSHPSLFSLLLI